MSWLKTFTSQKVGRMSGNGGRRKTPFAALIALLAVVLTSFLAAAPAGAATNYRSILKVNQVLQANDRITGPNGAYLIQQGDGNLVLYSGAHKVCWAAGKFGSGNHTVMQSDGNLVQYSSSNRALWASNTWTRNTSSSYVTQIGDYGSVIVNGVHVFNRSC
jgi:hypothetical protein